MPCATLTVADEIATIRMHDPARRNALGAVMLAELIAAFRSLPGGVRAVVLRAGESDRVWCAGFDIGALAPGVDPLAAGEALQTLFGCIAACQAPVIGMLHGSAWGGGTDLALRCDLLVGDETASLAFTPAKLGLPYDRGGLLNVLLRAGPGLAMEMFATAEPVGAARAHAAGLLNRLVASAALEEEVFGLARRIAANAPLTVTSAKRHLRALADAVVVAPDVVEALDHGRAEALQSADYREGLEAFRAKRTPRFRGA